jgi:hypothetical protein
VLFPTVAIFSLSNLDADIELIFFDKFIISSSNLLVFLALSSIKLNFSEKVFLLQS